MEELQTLFRSHGGWTVHMHNRNKGVKYVYASRKRGKKVQKVYFAPWLKVQQMSQEQVLSRVEEKLEQVQK